MHRETNSFANFLQAGTAFVPLRERNFLSVCEQLFLVFTQLQLRFAKCGISRAITGLLGRRGKGELARRDLYAQAEKRDAAGSTRQLR